MKKKVATLGIVTVVAGILFLLLSGLDTDKQSAQPGDEAIDFTLQDVDGNIYKLSDFRGKTVVLNFFATWCQPCIEEAPELEKFGAEYEEAQLLIIARGEPQRRIEEYIEETNSKLIYLLDTKEEVSDAYSVIGQPETVIINGDGMIVERFSGPTTKADLIRLIEEKA